MESENEPRLKFFNLNLILTSNILKIILLKENLHPGGFIMKNTSY